jgi:hypothetical protein
VLSVSFSGDGALLATVSCPMQSFALPLWQL